MSSPARIHNENCGDIASLIRITTEDIKNVLGQNIFSEKVSFRQDCRVYSLIIVGPPRTHDFPSF